MSNSTSQPQKDITSLASQVNTLEIDLSSNTHPRTICHPCGRRWLSLSPYKRATIFFDHWNEDTEALIAAPLATPEKNVQHDDIDMMSDSHISNFELDESETSGEFDVFEDAESRVLGALRCYYFNLDMGTLVTGEKVDKRVSNAIQKILNLSEGDVTGLKSSEIMGSSGIVDEKEPSDEERMVAELEWYIKQVQTHESKPTQGIVDVARNVVNWATERGTVGDGDSS
ncbi:hypothetical protein BKA65DRAFT_474038 [Rhexocercosporidium sp. MPI-PUGE-AT-0058]|nr:hypothetical protein BKA65DRAFT_474038 [Rhexocercosporidium sp. MPI-PUGE-AT-0058]